MALVNGGYFHCYDIKNSFNFFSENNNKKNDYGLLKNSGE